MALILLKNYELAGKLLKLQSIKPYDIGFKSFIAKYGDNSLIKIVIDQIKSQHRTMDSFYVEVIKFAITKMDLDKLIHFCKNTDSFHIPKYENWSIVLQFEKGNSYKFVCDCAKNNITFNIDIINQISKNWSAEEIINYVNTRNINLKEAFEMLNNRKINFILTHVNGNVSAELKK